MAARRTASGPFEAKASRAGPAKASPRQPKVLMSRICLPAGCSGSSATSAAVTSGPGSSIAVRAAAATSA